MGTGGAGDFGLDFFLAEVGLLQQAQASGDDIRPGVAAIARQ